jgi:predicted ArsR family transcriptional regulator
MSALRQLGDTRQRLLRALLAAPEGCTVEGLCERLGITHNAVRQHLAGLIADGFVERAQARPSGGRPLAVFRLAEAGRELFPRNYGAIATALLELLRDRMGGDALDRLMRDMGQALGRREVAPGEATTQEAVVRALADHLDRLGYEAAPARRGGEWQIEAFNCVFHDMARRHPEVCRFDIAYLEAAGGREVRHLECIVRGGACCRFKVGARKPEPER